MANASLPAATPATTCPRCDVALGAEGARCDHCGLTLAGKRVYDPRRFVTLALLFSALLPITLAAWNWAAVGRTRTGWVWLGLGFLGLTLLFTSLLVLPASWRPNGWVVALLLNVPLGYLLLRQQRPLYSAALRLGARPASLVLGSAVGLVPIAGAYVLAVVAQTQVYRLRFDHGLELAKQERHEEAAAVFRDLVQRVPKDENALFNLALEQAALGQWTESAAGLERFLRRNPRDAHGYAVLAFVRGHQGRRAECDSLATLARRLEPQVFVKIFGTDDPLGGDVVEPGSAGP